MRITDLPSAGRFNGSMELRRLCAKAISYHETLKMANGAIPASDAKTLLDFFFACHEAMVPVTAEGNPNQ